MATALARRHPRRLARALHNEGQHLKKGEVMGKTTLTCSDCDDLQGKVMGLELKLKSFEKRSSPCEKEHKLIWALDSLKALGEAVMAMSHYSSNSFDMFGGGMGQMIKDYAGTVEDILASSNKEYREFFEDA